MVGTLCASLAHARLQALSDQDSNLEYQIRQHNLLLWAMLSCLSAAVSVSKTLCAPWSASTLASKRCACALAGHEGRFTSLVIR